MKIAVDAMGGDHAPAEIVKGAVEAAVGLDGVERIYLVGHPEAIERELARLPDVPGKLEIVPASETIEMHEAPAQAVRKKKDSSIGRAVDLLKKGKADALVSAGNTGAVVVASTLKLRTIPGVSRPAIAAVMPTQGRPFVLVDAGANPDCDAQMLMQFAVMGSLYSKIILNRAEPIVGLLSIGGESTKGSGITKEAFRVLSRAPLNFCGNVEGEDLFSGKTDVAVCDGFVGNVVLKTAESVARAIGHWMKQEFKRTPVRMLGAAMLTGALRSMKLRMDPETYGGAPLLGVNGVCIITHGASSSRAIFNAIRVASESVHHHLNQLIEAEVGRAQELCGSENNVK